MIIFGFIYDLLFAGIPYQDTTPAIEATWQFHRSIADAIYKVGAILLIVGILFTPIIWLKTQNSNSVDKN